MNTTPTVFSRRELADCFKLEYDVVKNWSSGRPLRIGPSFRNPQTKGCQPLYTLVDAYRVFIALTLLRHGMNLGTIGKILAKLEDQWLEVDSRPSLLVWRLDKVEPEMGIIARGSDPSAYLKFLLSNRAATAAVSSGCALHLALAPLLAEADKLIMEGGYKA